MHLAHLSELRYGDKLARSALFPIGSVVTQNLLDILYSKNIGYVWVEDSRRYEESLKSFRADYNKLKGSEVYNVIESVLDKGALIPDVLLQLLTEDKYTLYHSINVAIVSYQIATLLHLPTQIVEDLIVASLLHDIGKLKIPKEVLLKNGRLTDGEFEIIKWHSKLGHDILKQYNFINKDILRGVSEHHEKFDGTGYYKQLSGYDIHIFARIIAVADVYDALVSKRAYKECLPIEKAIQIMREDKGHFDSFVLETFLNSIENTTESVNILRVS